jgi:hypothetical protein
VHDPLVVAFEIRRPWPRRDRAYDEKPGRVSLHSWRGPFWVIGGKGFYWPTMVTVWHREPGGRDSGEVCRHYVKRVGADGEYKLKILHGWRFHVVHVRWREIIIELPPRKRRGTT